MYDGIHPFIQTGDVARAIKYVTNYKQTLSDKGIEVSKQFKKGTLLMAIAANIGDVAILDFDTYMPDSLIAFKPNKSDTGYLFYLFSATKSDLNRIKVTNTQDNLNLERLNSLIKFVPSLPEQTTIATYLDTKTAQIDRKIGLLSQKATHYGQLKQALINETVTRGLDKTVPLKDSGVEWIGEVPAHWNIQRINNIARQQKIKNTGMRENNLLSLSYGKLKRKNIETTFGLLPESFETYQIVNKGNIILRLTDLQNDWTSLRVGLAKERGIITSAYLCLHFSKLVNPTFAYYLLHLYDLSKVFYWLGNGLRQTMRFEDIKVLPFVIPPIEEQQTIATYLDEKTAHINHIIETIHVQIDKLKELRKTLINDVVTGKVKVVTEGQTP
jgi:type I restriction enzyme S subunit